MRIGIDSPDTSHVRLFTQAFEDSDRIRVSAILSENSIRDRDVIQEFAEKHLLTLHDDRWHFADSVGAVLLLRADWSAHIDRAHYYLVNSKRIYIDKPVAGSFADIVRLRELLDQHPRQIFGGSALPHHHGFSEFLERFRFSVQQKSAEVEIFGAMDSYFMASHSYELASAILGNVRDAVVDWRDDVTIHSAIGQHEVTIALRQSPANANDPWSIRARIGGQLLLCSFPLSGIYDGLLHALHEHLLNGVFWDPGISTELALAAERSGHSGQPVSILDLDLRDVIGSEAFVADYRARNGSRPL